MSVCPSQFFLYIQIALHTYSSDHQTGLRIQSEDLLLLKFVLFWLCSFLHPPGHQSPGDMDPVSAPVAGKLLSGGPRRVFSANLCRPRSLLLLLLVGGTEEVGDLALAPAVSSAMRGRRRVKRKRERGRGSPPLSPLDLVVLPRSCLSIFEFRLLALMLRSPLPKLFALSERSQPTFTLVSVAWVEKRATSTESTATFNKAVSDQCVQGD